MLVPARAQKLLAGSGAAAFALQFVALDAFVRPPGGGAPLAARVASACVWTAVLLVATTTRRRLLAGAAAALVFVVQALVFRYYHAPLDVQVAATAIHAAADVRPVLVRGLPQIALAVTFVLGVELGALALARVARPRLRLAGALLAAAGVLLFAVGRLRDATPEVSAAHALTALRHVDAARAPVAGAVSLPPLFAKRRELPDVLFVLSESVRAEDYLPSGEAPTAPAAAALTPGRIDLEQMRAVSSYTAVSLSAILTGRSQEGARDEILRAPNLFDVAHAARDATGGMRVVYASAQSETVFEAKDVRASVDAFTTVESLVGRDVDDAEYVTLPLDAMATARFEDALRASPRGAPVFAVLHLAGTHAPYHVEDSLAPFAPWSHVVTWSGMPALHNAYKDAILAQDREVARALRAFEEHAAGRPRVVVFTSDHGEAFGEHGAIHHGQNLYDEQIHVPAWIWASPGALAPEETRALASARTRFTTHLDLLPTLLDVLGLGDNTALRDMRAKLAGGSLLRDAAPPLVPVTNCTGMFPCPLDTWGLLAGGRKLVAQRWDGDWACFDLNGPERFAPVGDDACKRMRAASQATWPTLPNGRPNR